ncbi:hypothetical protein BOTBODRAFT_177366 [Botryobasidium botryosum FD-172 SS1]|uniref:Mug135-like C-terminal domain-containing protein n=1 Tax=Botryobasidium botryosum (strain FD-172 SS1) TaxID=930990 RepID=A0A067M729_BOTB1|nr:hypothetical protein BOTBODRAFT_177366 [Botryobasidium botryosum FD-172 SS1]
MGPGADSEDARARRGLAKAPGNKLRITVIAEQNHNVRCGSGLCFPYHIVPLPDGSLPTDHKPQNGDAFPAILNERIAYEMEEACLNDYLTLYGLRTDSELRHRRHRLARYIGAF